VKALLLLAALISSVPALAQNWPTRPVRIIVSTAVGTTPDLVTRLLLDRLSKGIGRPVFIENLIGGEGIIATQAAARAAPDGYTFYSAGVGVVATDRYLHKTLPYDPDKAFVPVAMIYDAAGLGIGVRPDLPVRTVAELIAYAKANPGKLSYGTQPVGVIPLFGRWFGKLTSTEMVAVPYKTQPQMLADFYGGQLDLIFYSINTMERLHRAGKLRIIALGNAVRYPPLPDIPTVAETLPGFEIAGTGVLLAPTGIPADISQRMNRAMDGAVRDPEYVQKLHAMGLTATSFGAGTPQEIDAYLKRQRENWGRIMTGLNLQPQ
jgi:tripartite-type tricarboxylate transporter receptor subunit TctC